MRPPFLGASARGATGALRSDAFALRAGYARREPRPPMRVFSSTSGARTALFRDASGIASAPRLPFFFRPLSSGETR